MHSAVPPENIIESISTHDFMSPILHFSSAVSHKYGSSSSISISASSISGSSSFSSPSLSSNSAISSGSASTSSVSADSSGSTDSSGSIISSFSMFLSGSAVSLSIAVSAFSSEIDSMSESVISFFLSDPHAIKKDANKNVRTIMSFFFIILLFP